MKNPVESWIENHPDIVTAILTVANDPKVGRFFVTRDGIHSELKDRGLAIQKRKITYVLNKIPENFVLYSKRRNCGNITWKRVVI